MQKNNHIHELILKELIDIRENRKDIVEKYENTRDDIESVKKNIKLINKIKDNLDEYMEIISDLKMDDSVKTKLKTCRR